MKRLWLLFSQAVTVFLALVLVALVFKPDWQPGAPMPSSSGPVTLQTAPPVALSGSALSSLRGPAQRASPAVVSINTARGMDSTNPWRRYFYGRQNEQAPAGLGSGVIVSPEGYVLTNHHVIEGADLIEVVLNDDRRAQARLVGTDPESDLAVLKIELEGLPAITLGNSDELRVGDLVLAIGNPFGVGQTVTSGIVSAVGRNELGINIFEDFIQTDAAINPGNSGGALVDSRGYLVGINTAIYSRSGGHMGIGFAIPVSTARMVLESIVKEGRVTRGWIGVQTIELTPDVARTLQSRVREGVAITGVVQGGPADAAGLRVGDVVQAVGDKKIRSTHELLSAVSALRPGTPVRFEVNRRDERVELTVTPGRRPAPAMAPGRAR
ncbi:trypsin-like peptidase domain-containing protein [Ramlibacter sp. AW1]|uniref:Trypsin-like peptidase domain-containing protein n=1 Tax=Ramlibacter aurantiacus TaxID=2801330 RepID=A0A936ZSZ0_9BURK|nr:trypsin-like peptidase domain-containing protein [Ramlibacter aurantiacus]MBL0420570.1 trypsin-like peptidase domain-containing protein [Ramlibacter aurantiacus]